MWRTLMLQLHAGGLVDGCRPKTLPARPSLKPVGHFTGNHGCDIGGLKIPLDARQRRPRSVVPRRSRLRNHASTAIGHTGRVGGGAATAAPATLETGPAAAVSKAGTEQSAQLPEDVMQQFPRGEFSIEMQVRDYELDQFNVVNNAVYASYFQHGRHEAFFAVGLDVDEFARRGAPMALAQLNISFRAPLRSRDVFRVTVSVTRVTAARVFMHQRILKGRRGVSSPASAPQLKEGGAEGQQEADEELIAEAEAVVVHLDSQYRAARVPRDAARLYHAVADLKAPPLPK